MSSEGEKSIRTRGWAATGIRARIAMISGLRAGWIGEEEGEPFDAAFLSSVKETLERMVSLGATVPFVYPTEDSEIQAEWSRGNWEISVTFEPRGSFDFHANYICVEDASKSTEELLSADNPAQLFANLLSHFRSKAV